MRIVANRLLALACCLALLIVSSGSARVAVPALPEDCPKCEVFVTFTVHGSCTCTVTWIEIDRVQGGPCACDDGECQIQEGTPPCSVSGTITAGPPCYFANLVQQVAVCDSPLNLTRYGCGGPGLGAAVSLTCGDCSGGECEDAE